MSCFVKCYLNCGNISATVTQVHRGRGFDPWYRHLHGDWYNHLKWRSCFIESQLTDYRTSGMLVNSHP